MSTVIIGCKTLENELLRAMSECGCTYDVKWVKSGLHNTPNKLTEALQDVLDSLAGNSSRVIMAIGYCGNALVGLRTGDITLIIPRVDDCISLLLGSYKNKCEHVKDNNAYFITEGWLRGERNIWCEYKYTINKYGEETGSKIFEAMFGNYKTLTILDTGCFDIPSIMGEVKAIADTLKLDHKVVPATIAYIKNLLTGPWNHTSFLVIPPQSVISQADLQL